MPDDSLQKELDDLRQQINYHNYLYNTLDQPEISDLEFDRLYHRLVAIESAHPELITPDSPSQRAGAKVSDKFRKVNHPRPILSLANAFGAQAARDWYSRMTRLDPAVAQADYVLEPKLDGLTVVLHYEGGIFTLGATRGDGLVGEDITANLKTIATLPLRIPVRPGITAPDHIVFRGEVLMFKHDFEALNDSLEKAGEKTYLNPRNTAAGSLRQLDPSITARRPLNMYIYQIVESSSAVPDTQIGILNYIESLGLPVNPTRWHADSIDEAIILCEDIGLIRHEWPYDADGVVIKINDQALAGRLGVIGKDVRGALAFKYPGEEVETTLLDIQVNVGRTGVLTPLALLKPINIGGVVVKQATLHNFDFIADKDIRVGDQVLLKRAGEVIPYILASLPDKRDGSQVPYALPEFCPSCGSKVERDSEAVALYCPNVSCPAQLSRTIGNFASRGAMDINGLGEQIVLQLTNSGLVRSASGLYGLTRQDLLQLEGFGDKKADNLLAAIAMSKNQSLERLIIGLGIRGIGEVTAGLLARTFHNMDSLSKASEAQLLEVEGIGPNTAGSIIHWFEQPHNQEMLHALKAQGVWPVETAREISTGSLPLQGQTFVITGTLPTLSRDEASELIEKAGGKVTGSVSKKTSYLLLGEDPGSKYQKALDLGVPVISEGELREKIG